MNISEKEKLEWDAYQSLKRFGQDVLGPRQWRLFEYFGKLMTGPPFGGLYVSGIPSCVARALLEKLMDGQVVQVHLMHRHRSGCYEASDLCLREGRLVMLFDDRCEFA